MKSPYRIFQESVRVVTDYYLLLVDETRRERLVGSTNEWVLDNYYIISEQEKVLRVELKSRDFRRIPADRLALLLSLLSDYLTANHHSISRATCERNKKAKSRGLPWWSSS